MSVTPFDLHPERKLYIGVFSGVQDVPTLHERLLKAGAGNVAIVRTNVVLHQIQLRTAAALALENEYAGKLISHELHSEFLFCLGGSNNVHKALGNVQASPVREGKEAAQGPADLVLVKYDPTTEQIAAISGVVKAKTRSLDSLGEDCDQETITKLYSIKAGTADLSKPQLIKHVVVRIGTKFVR